MASLIHLQALHTLIIDHTNGIRLAVATALAAAVDCKDFAAVIRSLLQLHATALLLPRMHVSKAKNDSRRCINDKSLY